jgi:hypothetical protein
VHGDIRLANIPMEVRISGEPIVGEDGTSQLRLINFNWAGEHGKVRYPPERNDELVWPRTMGGLIQP